MTNRNKLLALNPCSDGLARVAARASLREWWETTTRRLDMMWAVRKAHSHGTLPRKRLVEVAARCAWTVSHLLPRSSQEQLATVCAWARGEDGVKEDALWKAHEALRNAYALVIDDVASDDVCNAAYVAVVLARSAIADDADNAATCAATAVEYVVAESDASDAVMCDFIREAIAVEEVCDALDLDPDHGVA
jgi:hypothetical protein